MNRTTHEIEAEEVMGYLDGELEASRASEVAAHMAGCAECATLAKEFGAISNQLAAWSIEPSATPAETILKSFSTRTQTEKKSPGGLRLFAHRLWTNPLPWRLAVGAGAFCLVAILAFHAVTDTREAGFSSRFASAKPVVAPQALSTTDVTTDSVALQQRRAQEGVSESLERKEVTTAADRTAPAAPAAGPMIARTAAMNVVVAKLDPARALLEKLLARHRGFASAMTLDKSNDASPSLDATLQVPSPELDAVLGELRGLGRVTTESQGGEDVSDQHVDLAARLHNEREAEQRLTEILRTRTGKLSDVVEVEEQISLTRGEIEQMEAQLANLDKRVAYASIKLQIAEEYKAPAATGNGSVGLRLRNAIVGGYRDAVESLIGLLAFLLNAGPMIVLWGFILFWPARALWKRRGFLRAAFGKS